jgi:hypothetical protein
MLGAKPERRGLAADREILGQAVSLGARAKGSRDSLWNVAVVQELEIYIAASKVGSLDSLDVLS